MRRALIGVVSGVLLLVFSAFMVGALISALRQGGLGIATFFMLVGTAMVVGTIAFVVISALLRASSGKRDTK